MKILLDTHVIIWALTDDSRLSQPARDLICTSDNMILYSVASLWELAIKKQKAPEKCPYRENDICRFCDQAGFIPLSIEAAHVFALRDLQIREGHFPGNQDPFDRILIAQAKTENCTLLSHDHIFEHYDENCIFLF